MNDVFSWNFKCETEIFLSRIFNKNLVYMWAVVTDVVVWTFVSSPIDFCNICKLDLDNSVQLLL